MSLAGMPLALSTSNSSPEEKDENYTAHLPKEKIFLSIHSPIFRAAVVDDSQHAGPDNPNRTDR